MTRGAKEQPQDLKGVLQDLEGLLVKLGDQLGGCGGDRLGKWKAAVNSRLLARFAPDAPLVAVICGGGPRENLPCSTPWPERLFRRPAAGQA